MLCDHLKGWDGVRGRKGDSGGRGHIEYLQLIHVDVWQTPAQYCKEIILQLK